MIENSAVVRFGVKNSVVQEKFHKLINTDNPHQHEVEGTSEIVCVVEVYVHVILLLRAKVSAIFGKRKTCF